MESHDFLICNHWIWCPILFSQSNNFSQNKQRPTAVFCAPTRRERRRLHLSIITLSKAWSFKAGLVSLIIWTRLEILVCGQIWQPGQVWTSFFFFREQCVWLRKYGPISSLKPSTVCKKFLMNSLWICLRSGLHKSSLPFYQCYCVTVLKQQWSTFTALTHPPHFSKTYLEHDKAQSVSYTQVMFSHVITNLWHNMF